MSKTTIAKKIVSLFGANLDDAVTKTGAKSKGKMTRADGSTYSLMGDDLLRIQDNISQYKGAGKTLAVLSPLALVAFADKKGEPLKTKKEATDFEKAFSKAHNAGEDTFTFKGKEFNTEVRKGKAKGSTVTDEDIMRQEFLAETTQQSKDEDDIRDMERQKVRNKSKKEQEALAKKREEQSLLEEKRRLNSEAAEKYFDKLGLAEGGLPDLTGDGKITQADVLKGRGVFQKGGSLMMPQEGIPVDTYDNIPPEEMDEAMASQLPDNEMEDDYTSYVMDESLDDEEQEYLAAALQNDPKLSDIMDKVITVASEFSGAGEVDGPGTGVSDSIPARLSDGEFVMTKKATDQLGADNLQVMMDDAERAYDGGYQMKAMGGVMDEEDPADPMMSKTKEEIEKLMMGANRMPSLQ